MINKLRTRLEPKVSRDWRRLAAQLDVERARTPAKLKEAALVKSAKSLGLTTHTLRMFINAERFLQRLAENDASLASQLGGAPAVAVVTVSRWFTHDQAGALQAAEKLCRGELSVRGLAAAERSARRGESTGPRTLKGNWLSRWLGKPAEWDYGPLVQDFSNKFLEPTAEERRLCKIDMVARSNKERLGLIVVGPYADARHYVDRAGEWMLKATGANWYLPRVGLVLPLGCSRTPFEKWEDDMLTLSKRDIGCYLLEEREDEIVFLRR